MESRQKDLASAWRREGGWKGVRMLTASQAVAAYTAASATKTPSAPTVNSKPVATTGPATPPIPSIRPQLAVAGSS